MPFKTGHRFSIDFLTTFRAKKVPKIDPKITQKSTSAPQGLPEASGELPRASQKPPGSHFGAIFGPILDQFGTSFGASLRLLHITWGPPAEHAFHQTVANTFRHHYSKGLFGTSEGQMRDTL